MNTKEILEKIKSLKNEIIELENNIPFTAVIEGTYSGFYELEEGLFYISESENPFFPSYTLASDNLDLLKEVCLDSDCEFKILVKGIETYISEWDSWEAKYKIEETSSSYGYAENRRNGIDS